MNSLKKPTPKFKGTITMGIFAPEDHQTWKNHVSPLEGVTVNVTVSKFREYKQRSNQQNAYYWDVIIGLPGGEFTKGTGLCGELGYTPEEMHEAIKYKFLAEPKEVQIKGKTHLIVTPVSTADLSTSDFELLMSKIRNWASVDLGVYLPMPNEVNYEF